MKPNRRTPFAQVRLPVNALISAGRVDSRSPIEHVLLVGDLAQVAFSVVERIAVDVVCLYPGIGQSKNISVQIYLPPCNIGLDV
jgi:hypothetical protein